MMAKLWYQKTMSKTHKKTIWNICCENPGDCWKGPLRPTLRFYHALLRKNKEAEAEAGRGNFWHLVQWCSVASGWRPWTMWSMPIT